MPTAIIDSVSGAFTRDVLDSLLAKEIARARRAGRSCSLCVLDIDHFKTINDAFGHARGDQVLKQVVERVVGTVRDADRLFRYGGDEFVLLQPDTKPGEALETARRIVDAIAEGLFVGDPPLTLSVSIGVATFPGDANDATGLLAAADRRGYLAKRRGRGRAVGDDDPSGGIDRPSRLIERDAELAAAHRFLETVLATGAGTMLVRGERGAGHSRFVEEVAKVAALHGFDVVTAAAGDARERPRQASRDEHGIGRDAVPSVGVLVIGDGVEESAQARDTALTLLTRRAPTRVGLVLAGAGTTADAAPAGLPLLSSVDLAPFSTAGIRVWLRTAVRGEPSAALISCIESRSGGLPARAERALTRLVDRGGIEHTSSGGWTLSAAAADVVRRRLPPALTGFIGRSAEIHHLSDLMQSHRLVTLVGPGGIGKTRLSLAVAAAEEVRYDEGAAFVPLAEATTAELVASAIAQAAGINERQGTPLIDTLLTELADRNLLLVLDNFEQVLVAAPLVARLLAAAPGISVLASSRERLRVSGEQTYQVPPLTLPSLDLLTDDAGGVARAVAGSSAIALFVARAQASSYDFALTAENVRAVAQLCFRLDGLPLAIELAAARCDVLSPEAMLGQLASRLDILAEGPRDVPLRQQALRAAIDWSVTMLTPGEESVFTQLGVFSGGCTLEAAAAVCGGPAGSGAEVARTLSALVDKSLLRTGSEADGSIRYQLLETTRLYAAERLARRADTAAVRGRHAEHYCEFAQHASGELRGPQRVDWLRALDAEYANLRAALDWTIDNGHAEIAARIALALYRFWYNGHHISESRGWFDRLLAAGDLPDDLLVRVLDNAAWLAIAEGDHAPARAFATRCIDAARASGDLRAVAEALGALGDVSCVTGDYAAARQHYGESLRIARDVGDTGGVATALGHLGYVTFASGALDDALAFATEALAIERGMRHTRGIVQNLIVQSEALLLLGNLSAARGLLNESVLLSRAEEHAAAEASAELALARVEQRSGRLPDAVVAATTALRINHQLGFQIELAECMEALAAILTSASAYPETAIELLGAADAVRVAHSGPRFPVWQPPLDAAVSALRATVEERRYAQAWAAGRVGRLDDIVAAALALDPAAFAASQPDSSALLD
ncbi:MAG: hypothetical protein QOG49_725 [Frankiaceae bacterium]|nr:hypothetical protein [Frankiaceae bacterium]